MAAGTYERGRAPPSACRFEPTDRDLLKIDSAWWADPDLAGLRHGPRLAGIAAALLEATEVAALAGPAAHQAARRADGTTIGWHQDWASWQRGGLARRLRHRVGVAFDDVDDANGAMPDAPGRLPVGLLPASSNFFATDRDGQPTGLAEHGAVDPARW